MNSVPEAWAVGPPRWSLLSQWNAVVAGCCPPAQTFQNTPLLGWQHCEPCQKWLQSAKAQLVILEGWPQSTVIQTSTQAANPKKNSEHMPLTWNVQKELPGIIYSILEWLGWEGTSPITQFWPLVLTWAQAEDGCPFIHSSWLQACSEWQRHCHKLGHPAMLLRDPCREILLQSQMQLVFLTASKVAFTRFQTPSKTSKDSPRFCSFQLLFLVLANPTRPKKT